MTRIDVVLIHDVDVVSHGSQAEADRRFEETMAGCYPALVELRRAGVIRAIGTGLNETAMTLRFAREADLDCVMLAGRYTLLEQGALDELLPLCERKGMSMLLAAPFNSGILAHGRARGRHLRLQAGAAGRSSTRCGASRRCARRHGVELPTAALQFPLGASAPRLDRGGRHQAGRGARERGAHGGAHPGRPVARAQARGAAGRGGAGAGVSLPRLTREARHVR